MIYLILLVGIFLRLIFINQSLWLDEATSILAARDFSISEILTKFSPGDFHPPGYYLMLKFWGSMVGFSEVGSRLLSVIAGMGTIFMVYKLATLITKNEKTALLSSAILATNPLHVYYSQEARMYALATLLAVVDVYLFIKAKTTPKPSNLILLGILTSLSLYIYYPLIFLVLSFFVYFLVIPANLIPVSIALAAGIISFFPWITTFATQIKLAATARSSLPGWWSILGKTSFKQIMLVWVKFLIGRISFYTKRGYIFYVFVISGIPLMGLFKSWINKRELILLWLWLVVPALALSIMGSIGSGFSYFRLLFILPAFCILLAYGIYTFSKSWIKFAIYVLIISQLTSLIIFWIKPRHHREDWRTAANYIVNNSPDKSVVVFENIGQADPLKYYTNQVQIISGGEINMNGLKHLWLMRYAQPIFDPEDNLKKKIEEEGFEKIREKDFNGVTIWEYQNL